MAKRPDRTQFLQSLELPVLIAHGSEDKIVPFSKARQLAEGCRKPLLVEMHGIGHASPLEAPDRTAQALARWIDACRADQEKSGEAKGETVSPGAP
jgi:pimeloyl-ACP methyl ester carboxylesterase